MLPFFRTGTVLYKRRGPIQLVTLLYMNALSKVLLIIYFCLGKYKLRLDTFWLYYITPCEFFTLASADSLSLEFEWQHISSGLQDTSQYSGRPQQYYSYFILLLLLTTKYDGPFNSTWTTTEDISTYTHLFYLYYFSSIEYDFLYIVGIQWIIISLR